MTIVMIKGMAIRLAYVTPGLTAILNKTLWSRGDSSADSKGGSPGDSTGLILRSSVSLVTR